MAALSYLFVPGDRPERFDKAVASGAHVVILDLEDAVLPERKAQARQAVFEWLQHTSAQVCVRINPPQTSWYEDDCRLLTLPAVGHVMLPKSEAPEDVAALARRLADAQRVLPLIETVEGAASAQHIAEVQRVERLAFGTVDFMADSGLQTEAALDPVRVGLVLASRRAQKLAPIDGVSLSVNDDAQALADARHAREWGFGAKLCIHPRQVEAVHRAFAPTEQEIAWAQRVVHAMAQGTLGAMAVDGKLVDRPVLLRAQAILGIA